MTPRPALLPRPGRGKAGSEGERPGCALEAEPRSGDFLPREEGAAVEVTRRGLRRPEAPAAAAREDAAGGSGVPRGRRHRGTAGEGPGPEAAPGGPGGAGAAGAAGGAAVRVRCEVSPGLNAALPWGRTLSRALCGSCARTAGRGCRGAARLTAPIKVPAGVFLRSPGRS